MRNYYYLVAGLPELVIDGTRRMPTVREFIRDTSSLIHRDDAALFATVQYPFDNKNLLTLLEKRPVPFDERGKFAQDELAELVRQVDPALPDYMRVFIEAYREGRLPWPEVAAESQLARLFHEAMDHHQCTFIREYQAFERDLRNVCVALSCRAAGHDAGPSFAVQRALVGGNEIAETLARSTAPDFSLSAQLPWMERVISANREHPLELERVLDAIRWDKLNELTVFSYFAFETILAFTIRLGMVERWQALEEPAGAAIFEQLVTHLTSAAHFA